MHYFERSPMQKAIKILLVLVCFILQGCTSIYMLPNGDTRVIGMVALTIAAPSGARAGTAFSAQNLGVLLYKHTDQSGMSLGYSDFSILQVENNACFIKHDKPSVLAELPKR